MSSISQAIDRIAIYSSKHDKDTVFDGVALDYMRTNGFIKGRELGCGVRPREYREFWSELSPEIVKEIELFWKSYDSRPRLSLADIEETVKDYPFQLPSEVIELYQRGNGCLPIGLDPSTDWNSFDNYIEFSFRGDPSFFTLSEAMDCYRACLFYHAHFFDPHWFPLYSSEAWIVAVIGDEEQQETSPIISFYVDDGKPEVEWSNLTNMLLTWVEIQERDLKYPDDVPEIKAIHQKYGRDKDELFWSAYKGCR